MSGFTKPTSLKAALKLALYGPAGSGKTFTALLLAEGLARQAGRRVAVLDTEQGTAFYSQPVPRRTAHPAPFEFDVLHTRSVTEAIGASRSGELAADYASRIAGAKTAEELRQVGQQLAPQVKSHLVPADLERVRQLYGKRQAKLKTTPPQASVNTSS